MHLLKLALIGAALLCWWLRARPLQGSVRWYFLLLLFATVVECGGAWLIGQGSTTNTLYQIYIPLEIVLAALFIASSSTERWPRGWPLLALVLYTALLAWEWRNSSGSEILFSKSLLFAWALLVLGCCAVLLQRSYLLDRSIVRTWQFWALLSLLGYFGLALPTVGLVGELYAEDPVLAGEVYLVMDILYFFRYGLALVAGLLLTARDQERTISLP
jgi:hypothetical protein